MLAKCRSKFAIDYGKKKIKRGVRREKDGEGRVREKRWGEFNGLRKNEDRNFYVKGIHVAWYCIEELENWFDLLHDITKSFNNLIHNGNRLV